MTKPRLLRVWLRLLVQLSAEELDANADDMISVCTSKGVTDPELLDD